MYSLSKRQQQFYRGEGSLYTFKHTYFFIWHNDDNDEINFDLF
jgi:hypothetical protein